MVDTKQKKAIRKQKRIQIRTVMEKLNVPPLHYKLNFETMGFTIDFESLKRYCDFMEWETKRKRK